MIEELTEPNEVAIQMITINKYGQRNATTKANYVASNPAQDCHSHRSA